MTYRAVLFCNSGLVAGNDLANHKFLNLEECIKTAKAWLKYDKLGDGYNIINSDGHTVCKVTK